MAPTAPPSLDAPALRALQTEWTALRARHPDAKDPAFASAVRPLAARIVAHRARLFLANAELQANAEDDDDVTVSAQLDANQDAIKACTNVLTEMGGALGWASIPD